MTSSQLSCKLNWYSRRTAEGAFYYCDELLYLLFLIPRFVYNKPTWWPALSWLVSSSGRALYRNRRIQGFKFPTSLNFFRLSLRAAEVASITDDRVYVEHYFFLTLPLLRLIRRGCCARTKDIKVVNIRNELRVRRLISVINNLYSKMDRYEG